MVRRGLVVAVSALLMSGVSPRVLYAQQFLIDVSGANGGPGDDGVAGGADADPGGNGNPGGVGSGNNPDNRTTSGQTTALGTAKGGDGGNGGDDFGLDPDGGRGGDGGQGGQITISNSGNLTATGNRAFGLFGIANGGNGGNGGSAEGVLTGAGDGGNGGSAGTATAINNGATIITSGNEAFGLAAQADGGNGGNGGELQDDAQMVVETLQDYAMSARERRRGLSLVARFAKLIDREMRPDGNHHRLLRRYLGEARARRNRAFAAWVAHERGRQMLPVAT